VKIFCEDRYALDYFNEFDRLDGLCFRSSDTAIETCTATGCKGAKTDKAEQSATTAVCADR
jgi:hypothetical protein